MSRQTSLQASVFVPARVTLHALAFVLALAAAGPAADEGGSSQGIGLEMNPNGLTQGIGLEMNPNG